MGNSCPVLVPPRQEKGARSPDVLLVGCCGGLEGRFEVMVGAMGSRYGNGFGEAGVGFVVVGVGVAPLKWGQGGHCFFGGRLADWVQVSTRLEFGGGCVEGRWALVAVGAVVLGVAGFVLGEGPWGVIGVVSFLWYLGLIVRRAGSDHDAVLCEVLFLEGEG